MNDHLTPEELDYLVDLSNKRIEEKRLNGLKTPITIKCVVCDIVIENSFPEHSNDGELAESYANSSSFHNGAVGVISFGYGCCHDSDVLIIGICESCYRTKRATKSVLFTRSYQP